MRRSGVVLAAGILLAALGGGALTANALMVRDETGAPVAVDQVVATPDPALAEPAPAPTAFPSPPPDIAPVAPAPPQDVDDDDDDDDDIDDDDD